MTEPGWFGDPNITHEPGAEPAADGGWRPVCSCGFRAPLTHDTEDGARRAAQAHVAVSSALAPGRYSAVLDGGTVHIRCDAHPGEPLASFPARGYASGPGGELREVLREHDLEYHEDDRHV